MPVVRVVPGVLVLTGNHMSTDNADIPLLLCCPADKSCQLSGAETGETNTRKSMVTFRISWPALLEVSGRSEKPSEDWSRH